MHRYRLKTLGLYLAIATLGVMAFAAAGAQAEALTGELGTFLVLGAVPAAGTLATGRQVGSGKLLVPLLGLTLECTAGDVNEGKFTGTTGMEALIKVVFLGCKTFEFEAPHEELPCTVHNTGFAVGEILATAILLPVKHNGGHYVVIHPDGSTKFAEVKLEGPECPVPLNNVVTGLVAGEVLNALEGTHSKVVHFNEAIQKLLAAKLKYGTNGGEKEAFIDALVEVELVAVGCTFSMI